MTSTGESGNLEAKMKLVAEEMSRQATDPADKEIFKNGKVFVNLEGLDMAVVGVKVPNNFTGKHILVSFTQEYFQQHDISTLAKAGLEDFYRARNSSKPQQK